MISECVSIGVVVRSGSMPHFAAREHCLEVHSYDGVLSFWASGESLLILDVQGFVSCGLLMALTADSTISTVFDFADKVQQMLLLLIFHFAGEFYQSRVSLFSQMSLFLLVCSWVFLNAELFLLFGLHYICPPRLIPGVVGFR